MWQLFTDSLHMIILVLKVKFQKHYIMGALLISVNISSLIGISMFGI